ncbi:hypothetical protein QQP08_017907 [Theobroma cacao]|nr:hypothetical protein QQP08_017907 [Theobroma cacao]
MNKKSKRIKLKMSDKNKEIPANFHADLNVNLAKLWIDSYGRYCMLFKIDNIDSDSSREQVLDVVQQHIVS